MALDPNAYPYRADCWDPVEPFSEARPVTSSLARSVGTMSVERPSVLLNDGDEDGRSVHEVRLEELQLRVGSGATPGELQAATRELYALEPSRVSFSLVCAYRGIPEELWDTEHTDGVYDALWAIEATLKSADDRRALWE